MGLRFPGYIDHGNGTQASGFAGIVQVLQGGLRSRPAADVSFAKSSLGRGFRVYRASILQMVPAFREPLLQVVFEVNSPTITLYNLPSPILQTL